MRKHPTLSAILSCLLALNFASAASADQPETGSLGGELVAKVAMPAEVDTSICAVELYQLKDAKSLLLALRFPEGKDDPPAATHLLPIGVFSSGGGLQERPDDVPLQLWDVTGDGVPEIIFSVYIVTGNNRRVRVFRINDTHPDCLMEPVGVATLLLETNAPRIRRTEGGSLIMDYPFVEEFDGYPCASTIYAYKDGALQPVPTEGKTTCPPGWIETACWAIDSTTHELVLLKSAVTDQPRDNFIGSKFPRELSVEGTANEEVYPPYRFSDSGAWGPTRRIYFQLGRTITPLLPYQELSRIRSSSLPISGSFVACASEARCDLLPAVTKNDDWVIVNTADQQQSYHIPPPVRAEISRSAPCDTANRDVFRWLNDDTFVAVRTCRSDYSWAAYQKDENGKFRQVAQGSRITKFSQNDSSGTLAVLDGKLVLLPSGYPDSPHSESLVKVLFDPSVQEAQH